MNNDNMNRLPHMNPNNYDQYAPPISKEPVVFSDQWKNENLVMSKFTVCCSKILLLSHTPTI